MRYRHLALVLVVATLAGCAENTAPDVRVASPIATTEVADGPVSTTVASRSTTATNSTTSTNTNNLPANYRDAMTLAIDDLQEWWRGQFPATYSRPYTDVKRVIAARRGITDMPSCGRSGTGRYNDVKGNAFYCPDGKDFIAYDDEQLFPDLAAEFGVASTVVVLAHEWGHAVQFRADLDESSIIMEQQADCFAGAWTAHSVKDARAKVRLSEGDLNTVLAALISVSDSPGTTANDLLAHGSGFDRASAFRDGYVGGAKECATYPAQPPTTIQLPFTSRADVLNGGNLPLADTLALMAEDLDRFWRDEFAAESRPWVPLGAVSTSGSTHGCTTKRVDFCPKTATVSYSDSFIKQAYREGDFAVGLLFGLAWTEAALTRQSSPLKGQQRTLRADCLVGAWTHLQVPGKARPEGTDRTLSLSPGDLDEGVIAFLSFGETADSAPVFDRLAKFRAGLLQGSSACQ